VALAPIREDAQLFQREIQVDRDEPDDGACTGAPTPIMAMFAGAVLV
jgi:hypothetical protein